MKLVILSLRSWVEVKDPRRRTLRARMENQSSIWLSQEACLALQLQLPFQVGLVGFGLVAAAPDGPCDDESRLDPALG